MAKVQTCQAPNCNNSFIPKQGAKRALYCCQACNQRAYNARKRANKKAQARTLTLEESAHYIKLSERIPELESALDRYENLFGHDAVMATIKLMAGIAQEILA